MGFGGVFFFGTLVFSTAVVSLDNSHSFKTRVQQMPKKLQTQFPGFLCFSFRVHVLQSLYTLEDEHGVATTSASIVNLLSR